MLTVDVAFLTILVGTALPILVGVVTKANADSRLKSVLLALFSGIGGVAVIAIEQDGLIEKDTLIAAAVTFVTAAATYYGFWKPTGVAPAVQNRTADVGLG